jgi:lipid II:glycine glycyltransferase (peptidoglycan interpeptide bridge formation enzyme)
MQKKLGYEPLYLVFEKEGQIIYSLLLILFRARRGTYLFCPYGVHDQEQMTVLLDFLKSYGKQHKVDFLRFSPLMADTDEHKKLFKELKFRPAPVHMMHPELLWLLDISKDEKTLLNGMRKNTRYGIRQAEKLGVKIESGASEKLLGEFYEIHEETSRRQHFVPYPWKYLQSQLEVFGQKDEVRVYIAEFEGKKIAGAVIMFHGKEGVYHHGASLSEYNKIPASYAIQWEAIKEAKKRGMSRYNFWGVVDNAPKHPWAGLSFFKKGFGGEGQNIIHCQDLPLTPKYWLNWVVETLRRIKRGY